MVSRHNHAPKVACVIETRTSVTASRTRHRFLARHHLLPAKPPWGQQCLSLMLWQEQLSFQAVENSLILQKCLVGVASLCHKEIGVQTESSDDRLSHSFPVPCKSISS